MLGALFFILLGAFIAWHVINGVLPSKGLKYLLQRADGKIPQDEAFEKMVKIGTGLDIDTTGFDEDEEILEFRRNMRR